MIVRVGAVWQDSIHFIFGYSVDSAKVKKVSHNRPSLFLHLYLYYHKDISSFFDWAFDRVAEEVIIDGLKGQRHCD